MQSPYIIPFDKLGIGDIDKVGGKNASIGEMIIHLAPLGVRVPSGFATTSQAYRGFEARALAAQSARAERRQSSFVRQFSQRIGLFHELRKLG